MRIAIPLAGGKLTPHFGRCESFALVELDDQARRVVSLDEAAPPAHAPGVLPRWIVEQGADLVLAGGMGPAAVQMLEQAGVEVILGVAAQEPRLLAEAYLAGTLPLGDNACDH